MEYNPYISASKSVITHKKNHLENQANAILGNNFTKQLLYFTKCLQA